MRAGFLLCGSPFSQGFRQMQGPSSVIEASFNGAIRAAFIRNEKALCRAQIDKSLRILMSTMSD